MQQPAQRKLERVIQKDRAGKETLTWACLPSYGLAKFDPEWIHRLGTPLRALPGHSLA
jgi:hypothetical protein